jgi:hypothetical protein
VIDDNQAQEKSEKTLQNVDIGNDTLCCPEASALQALIPCVKRFLQLFPETKVINHTFFFHLMRIETGFISLKQDVILNGLAKAPSNLTVIL